MNQISVVIIAKNEAGNIVNCIESARLISDDIIVADNGSEDNTPTLVQQSGARLFQTDWKGYGENRNNAALKTNYDWVLALDADERITPELAITINHLSFTNDTILYGFKRKNFLAGKKINFGEWGRDKVYRLYNKQHAAWDLQPVHENVTGNGISRKLIPGQLLHYTMNDLSEYKSKTILYARLSAHKYATQGKKATFIKRYLSPVFSFVQNYFFRLGFLDGKEGFIIAYTSSRYVFLKYKYLHLQLQEEQRQTSTHF